jgi:hypothetical protein
MLISAVGGSVSAMPHPLGAPMSTGPVSGGDLAAPFLQITCAEMLLWRYLMYGIPPAHTRKGLQAVSSTVWHAYTIHHRVLGPIPERAPEQGLMTGMVRWRGRLGAVECASRIVVATAARPRCPGSHLVTSSIRRRVSERRALSSNLDGWRQATEGGAGALILIRAPLGV